MTPAAIIREALADGVSLALSPVGTLKATGDQVAVNRWLPVLREHKPALLAALTEAPRVDVTLWWRVSITEPGGRVVELDMPSGQTLAEAQAYADRYHGPGCVVTPIHPVPGPRAPVSLDNALTAACEGVDGITTAQFRSLLDPEDVVDIEDGGLHPRTLRGYAESFAEGMRSGRIEVPEAEAITVAEIDVITGLPMTRPEDLDAEAHSGGTR